MEKPYNGRAILNDKFNGLEISIPTKKNWFIILFLGGWLGGWAMGEFFAIGAVTGVLGKMGSARLFVLFWLIAWTAGGFFAFRTFLWNLMGKEVITFGQGQLTIEKKGTILFKPKTYDLNEAKNFRIQDDDYGFGGMWGGRRNDFWTLNTGGTIRFDYGLQTVKFAGGIDEAEAKSVLSKLKGKKLLSDKNFESNN